MKSNPDEYKPGTLSKSYKDYEASEEQVKHECVQIQTNAPKESAHLHGKQNQPLCELSARIYTGEHIV